jgi:hypothetical protein
MGLFSRDRLPDLLGVHVISTEVILLAPGALLAEWLEVLEVVGAAPVGTGSPRARATSPKRGCTSTERAARVMVGPTREKTQGVSRCSSPLTRSRADPSRTV